MAVVAGIGAAAQKIGLKKQASRRSQRISDSASSQIAAGVTAAATQGVRGDCAASQPRVLCRPFLRPSPRERRGRQTRCMRYLKPSIHSVSARVPRPSAASIAALYPRNA
jgi:hypothetical protein